MKHQGELFDGFVRLRECRKCKRKLHVDPKNKYQTRQIGLCFDCVRIFEDSGHWTVESFLEATPVTEEELKAIAEFESAVNEFRALLDSPPLIAFRTKVQKSHATQHELFTHDGSDSEANQDSHSAHAMGESEAGRDPERLR